MEKIFISNLLKELSKTSPAYSWFPPPKTIVIENDEIHVWRAFLDLTTSHARALLHHTLSADEQARAECFHFQKDREHFIVARAVLRDILSRYLNRQPDALRFRYNNYGKPFLARELSGNKLRFNVSHSYGLALYAITRDREIGIDLEHMRSDLAIEQIAERFFSPREVTMLRTLPGNMQKEAFFNCWTRKEAYIKARGEGLSTPLSLDQFDVSLAPGEAAVLLRTKEEPYRWSLYKLDPAPGYIAAFAAEGKRCQFRCWQWQGVVDGYQGWHEESRRRTALAANSFRH